MAGAVMRRGTLAGLVATGAALAVVIGASVVWPGLDAQETPDVDASVWALQTGEGLRYARVNTSVGELDTVRGISNPDQVVQTGDAAYVFSGSFSKVTRIDETMPVDLDEEALESSASTPTGTTEVATAGDYVAYLTDSGAVFAGRLSGTSAQLDPFSSGDEDAPQYTADAIAVDGRGMLFAYSRADDSVLRYDIADAEVRGRDPLEADGLGAPAITAAGDTWAVVDTEDGDIWLRGVDAATTAPTTGTLVVATPDATGSAVYLADETSLVRVPVDGSDPEVEAGGDGTVLGVPAQPIARAGETFAAWLRPGEAGGTLWRSGEGLTALEYGDDSMPDQRRPVFVASASAVILNETRSGWAWSVPDGELIASSQDWSLDDRTDAETVPSDEQLQVVLDPKPPIAEPDAFGVRAGGLVSLPVLMNDHDPNEDVLTIDPASVAGLDPGFGVLTLTDDAQRFAVRVTPDATGSATFSYAVTDGTASGGDGLTSAATTVTLTVAPPGVESAPEWCGVERCLVEWPQPEVERGGTVTVPVLPGWVDPEGDPLLLLSVEDVTGGGSVAATPGGEVVYQHSDTGEGGEQLVDLAVTVADTQGRTAVKSLVVRVSPEPNLTAQSFAVIDVVGSGITVDVADHVTGTAGAMSLDSVRVLDDAAATATIVGGSTSFDFTAKEPGTYRVDFTVTDGASEAIGTARITLLPADAPAQLATSPVVAFVHPRQDATLEVFDAVSNPTRRVLLLSDIVARADAGASLSVDAVGQNHLRVSGSTADGAPGRLGTVSYVVSDGTDDAGSQVEGQATVYLLPPAPELAPIAVDDAVIVRTGAQIDIPVLDNDISPAGGRPTIDPASVTSTSDEALAFASGDVLRYLAPAEPGDYEIRYSVFTTGAPSLADAAAVRVRVIDDEANRAPTADTLEGRALSGQETRIPFEGFGADPDGDVVTLDRIVTQPERGAARVSADGTSIVYTSVPGDSGQMSFRYRVVDAFGQSAEGTVRVGVLDDQANPSPVTFTDYVQVQMGSTIKVSPLSNDVDPTLGALRVTDVRPDAPTALADGSANPEHARLTDRIGAVDDTTVEISAGDEPTTMSFLYDIESTSGNTGRGLIVVRVVRESVPDYPIVADTILTVETRDDFRRGVDVLDGKVQWSGGDASQLEVSLWGDPDDVSVDGRRLSGELPAKTRLIPFAVTGEGASGEVTTYAFLRVPGDDDLALALRAGAASPEVQELESTTFDMSELVARPRGSRLEVGDDARAAGARAEATCAVESGTTVRYEAGAGAPWVDACQVPVRLDGQDEWTYLSVPIVVHPLDPQPELHPGSLTVGPGETASFDLRNMTTWQLREDWGGIRYALEYSGTALTVSQDGSIVTVTGADRAIPGAEEVAIVSVTSHPAVPPARLILRVGAAPSTLPQGGSVVGQCSQATGTACTIPVIGAGSEVNPLPGTPLELVDVRPTGVCTGVSFAVASSSAVTATWTPDAAGTTCTAAFSVRDAQGRVTSSERDGRLLLDLLGYPKAPASIAQVAFADRSVTLRVDPGEARQAYPALTGFVVRSGGTEVVRCSADGVCPAFSAPNGEQRTYEAWALNSVGESRSSVRTVAWAYDTPPAPGRVTAAPVVTGDGAGGVVSLVVEGVDAESTGSLEITSDSGETVRVAVNGGRPTVEVPSYRVGTNSRTLVTVTPYSRFEIPNGLGGSLQGGAATVWANGVGAPLDPNLTLTSQSAGDGTSTVTATAAAVLNGDGSTLLYGVAPGGGCTPTQASPTFTFAGLEDGREHTFTMCVASRANDRTFGTATASATVRAEQSRDAPTGYTFVVGAAPREAAGRFEWVIGSTPTSPEQPPRFNEVQFSGYPPTVFDRNPGIQVWYRHRIWGTESARANVVPASGSAPYQVWASWGIGACVGGGVLSLGGDSSTVDGTKATITWSDANVVFRSRTGSTLAYEGGWRIPPGTASIEGLQWTASWGVYGLNNATKTLSVTNCERNDPLPTGVVAGTPGHFTPDYARLPGNLNELNGIGSLGQTTAWTEGQYMVLGNGSDAYWNGTTWGSGRTPPPDDDDDN